MDEIQIIDIVLSIEKLGMKEIDYENDFSDVLVQIQREGANLLEDYVSTMFTFSYTGNLLLSHGAEGSHFNGSYIFTPNLILIKSLEKGFVREVIDQIIEEGDFFSAFRKLN